ncbi:MAG: hypothetical protein LAP40_07685 [Acidobacteriia bacterium]|nr:hypothetical protein [Terriglobia bacterium]
MTSYWALQAVVLAIAFVILFDRVHDRNRNYRNLWRMYRELHARKREP